MSDSASKAPYVTEVTRMLANLPRQLDPNGYYKVSIGRRTENDWFIAFSDQSSDNINAFLKRVADLEISGVVVDQESSKIHVDDFSSFHKVFAKYTLRHLDEETYKELSAEYLSILDKYNQLRSYQGEDEAVNSDNAVDVDDSFSSPLSAHAFMNGFYSILINKTEECREEVSCQIAYDRFEYIIEIKGYGDTPDEVALRLKDSIYDLFDRHATGIGVNVHCPEGDENISVCIEGDSAHDFIVFFSSIYSELGLYGPEDGVDRLSKVDRKKPEVIKALNELKDHFDQTLEVEDLVSLPMKASTSRDDMLEQYFIGYNMPVSTSLDEIKGIVAHEHGREDNTISPMFRFH